MTGTTLITGADGYTGRRAAAAPLDQVDARTVTRIVHAAAVTRFSMERDLARHVERDGAFRGRQLVPPVDCDQESFNDLVAAASQFHGRGSVRESLAGAQEAA